MNWLPKKIFINRHTWILVLTKIVSGVQKKRLAMLLFGDKLNTIKDITITGKHAKYLVHNIKEAIGFDFTLTGVINLILLNCQRFDAYKWPNTQHPG